MDPALAEHQERITNRLMERTATLFLGAGVNANILDDAGVRFPLGSDLANSIAGKLLDQPDSHLSLAQTAQLAKAKVGEQELNRFLFDHLTRFRPGIAHLAAVQLPWDSIYTTNYDLLLETAATDHPEILQGNIYPIHSQLTDISDLIESDIPYYKLHGSIDVANTPEGRLILTQSDFFDYQRLRVPMFKRLRRDLSRRTFVFVGYALEDQDFLRIIEECKQELEMQRFPPSFAIKQRFSNAEAAYWQDIYNITLLSMDAAEFLLQLKESWSSQQRMVVPLEQRRFYEYLQVDQSSQFPKIGESFVRVDPSEILGTSDPAAFFSGTEPTWADIRDQIAPKREQYWTVLNSLVDELVDPSLPSSAILVTGAAGHGKTTLIRSLAFDLSNEFSTNCEVFVHIPSTPLSLTSILPAIETGFKRRPVIFVRHAAEYIIEIDRLLAESRHLNLPITVILEERKNQWDVAAGYHRVGYRPVEIELSNLERSEIELILDALAKYDCLGKLTGTPRSYQLQHFEAIAHKELLVSLRELTSQTTFDHIIEDEFEKIPNPVAKQAYVYVATLGQFDLSIRYETIMHILQIGYEDLGPTIFGPTKGVLLSGEEVGQSRHNVGFRLSARHPVIASIVFAKAAPSDDDKLDVINRLLTHIDPGHREDEYLLHELIRTRQLVETIEDESKKRSIYDRYESILPGDPFVLQQRSMLERDLNASEEAVSYARKAVRIRPGYSPFQNVLGLALEHLAREVRDPLRRQSLLREASNIFDNGIRQSSTDAYSYLGKYYVMRQEANDETNPERNRRKQAAVISLLREAYEETNENPMIAPHLAREESMLGSRDQAMIILKRAIEVDPSDTRVRDLLIQYTSEEGNYPDALTLAYEGVTHNPTSWQIQRHIARLLKSTGGRSDSIEGHYRMAIRHRAGDINLLVELGAFLFENGKISESTDIFNTSRALNIPMSEKRRHRRFWKASNGLNKRFQGRIRNIRGSVVTLQAVPDNFEVTFWMNHERFSGLRPNQTLSFIVAYNAFGANAMVS